MKNPFLGLPFGLLCGCPVPTAIGAITKDSCPFDIGQVRLLLFQRWKNGSTINKITIATTNPNVQATWDTLTAAADSTKVISTPNIAEPVTEVGGRREFGGGNATPGGAIVNMGRDKTEFSAKFLHYAVASIEQLMDLECEELAVFLVDEFGKIHGQTDSLSSPTQFWGFRLQGGLFVGDRHLGGFEEPDHNVLQFGLEPNWSKKLHSVTPVDFTALEYFLTV